MLKNIPSIISPALIKVLMEMGHGDEIIIADGNFPVESMGKDTVIVRADGHGVADLLDAILQLIPLDQYTQRPVALMQVVEGDPCVPHIWHQFKALLAKHEPDNCDIEMLERFEFYQRAKKAYAIIATGESAIYANIMLKKGVVK